MAKENDCANCDHEFDITTLRTELADTKKKLDESTTKVKELEGKVTESDKKTKDATDELTKYIEAEGKALADSIVKRTDFKAEDLKDKSVVDLRNIHSTIDHVKVEGTVKPVRGAATSTTKMDLDSSGQNTFMMPIGRPKHGADGSLEWVVD